MKIPQTLRMLKRRMFRRSDGERVLRETYESTFGGKLDCDNPRTFTEKLFCRMIAVNRTGNPRYAELSDKYLVRQYVARKLGERCLNRLFWHGEDPHSIPFQSLPQRCVIKTNHGSGGHLFVNGTPDREQVIRHLERALKANYYWVSREYQYYHIHRRILIEEFLEDGQPEGPLDFRFWCFNGVAQLVQVDNRSHTINPFYDPQWNKLDLRYRDHCGDEHVEKPDCFAQMLAAASTLADGFDFVRVDLYNIRGEVRFGEMTFTPRGGHLLFRPRSWDRILGEKWMQRAELA